MSLYNVSNLHIIRSVLRQWCWSGFLLNIVFNGALYLRSSPIYILQISLPRAHITIFRRAFSISVFLFLLDMCKYIKECTAWMVLKYSGFLWRSIFEVYSKFTFYKFNAESPLQQHITVFLWAFSIVQWRWARVPEETDTLLELMEARNTGSRPESWSSSRK